MLPKEKQMFGKHDTDKTNVSADIRSAYFLEQIRNFLPTYNANGEIEVW